ncbi:Npun_F0813 family protein [Leptolyngbya ohadii]|uniref:Npun_F0813 family protein n=1 Tax=Leptolyngbya ohadii TaxID=1962290 RepID=UPI000B5A1AA7|nr:Npun_F0813 family protein [Leptolyngbya ohadii]
MFILKRQDVEISNIQHPRKEQQIPILQYQGQTFRLISVFSAAQEEDAKAFWRDLTDNRGKACVLLEEPERYSVWGKVRLEQLLDGSDGGADAGQAEAAPVLVQACLVLLQALYLDIEDLLGGRQVSNFQKEMMAVFQQGKFPKAITAPEVQQLLSADPLRILPPPWQEAHLNLLLRELHRLGMQYFGNTSFTDRVLDALEDLSEKERTQFFAWLKRSPGGKFWQ